MQYVATHNIPGELKALNQWVLWKYRTRDGKATKVPFQASGVEARANDKTTWSSFEDVRRGCAVGNWEGIGFEFSVDDPYTGIDLDGCRDPETQLVEPWAKQIILQFATYAEVSPSKTGVKLWVRGQWNYETGHKVFVPDVREIEGKKAAVEVYDSGRYFAVTGTVLAGQRVIADRQKELDELRKRFWPDTPAKFSNAEWRSETSVLDRARKYIATIPGAVSGAGGHDATFKVACTLVLGFELPDSDALNLLSEWNQSCQPPWSERDLKHKIQSAGQQGGERGYLRNVAPKNYGTVSIPEHKPRSSIIVREQSVPVEFEAELKKTNLEDAARSYLVDTVEGRVKLIELGLPDLDYAIGGGVEAGEMIVFAARPSHAKSACSLQVVHHFTANNIPCLFVSEEMSSKSLGKRTIQFSSEVHRSNWAVDFENVNYDLDQHFSKRAPCYVIERCKSVSRVAYEIKKSVKEDGIGLAVVDYAQLLQGVGKTRYEAVTNVCETLKRTAQDCNIPMIVLAQMSRKIEDRPQYIPQMSDIKETGSFEQDADVIIFQVWPWKLDSNKYDPKEYHLFVGKNREREINQAFVKCIFEPVRQRLVSERPVFHEPARLASTKETRNGFEPDYNDETDRTGLDLEIEN